MPNKRQLRRQLYEIKKTTDGYAITAPVHRGLVLSGGGAKGIAYSGMVKAMVERGFLQSLTHICGASAGAITGSLLAIGMNYADIDQLIRQLDITKLMDKPKMSVRATGDRLRNLLEAIYFLQLDKHFNELQEPVSRDLKVYGALENKLTTYKDRLNKNGLELNSIDDIIKLTENSNGLNKLDEIFKQLVITPQQDKPRELPNITFEDLKRLRTLLPDDKKHLIKHFSVGITNQTRHTQEVFGEENTPNESLAKMVQISAAHPALFIPRVNDKNEFVADGGIIDNMPNHVLETLGLHPEEILCVKIEADEQFESRVNTAKNSAPETISRFYGAVDSLAQRALGGRLLENRSATKNQEKVFYYIDNMLFLNTGTIKTTTTTLTDEQKDKAIATAYSQTMELFDDHLKVFNHPLLAVLYLGIDQLNREIVNDELMLAASQAKAIALMQDTLVAELEAGNVANVERYIREIEEFLDWASTMNEQQKDIALALCIKQIDHLSEGALGNALIRATADETDNQKIGWFDWLLNLLWAPIKWVISLCRPTPANDEPEEVRDLAYYTKIYGFFTRQLPRTDLIVASDLQPDV